MILCICLCVPPMGGGRRAHTGLPCDLISLSDLRIVDFLVCSAFYLLLKQNEGGFPGGTVVKKPPANAGDTGLIPGPGRSHTLQSN